MYAKQKTEYPDKKVYNKNYGLPYRLLRIVCIPGIAYYITGLILANYYHILIPGAGFFITAWFIGIWITASIIGIPLSFIIAHMSFKRFKNDYLIFTEKNFIWHRHELTHKLGDETIERINEYTVLEISNKSSETKGYFKIKGVIEQTGIRNNKRLKPVKINRITIPKVFSNMENIYKYPLIEEQVLQKSCETETLKHIKKRKEKQT